MFLSVLRSAIGHPESQTLAGFRYFCAAFFALWLSGFHMPASAQSVRLPNGEYTEAALDLSVKVLGGEVRLERTWVNGRWYLNPAWADLRFIADPLDDTVRMIDRNGSFYERSGNSDLFVFQQVFIRRTEEGWRWYDRIGNWITYDAAGRITAYGDKNDVAVRFIYDNQSQRAAIHDHHGKSIYSFAYVADKLVEVTDYSGRKIRYEWQGDRLTKVTDVRGYDWQYTYDSNGQIIQRTDPLGATIKVVYAGSVVAGKPAMSSGKHVAAVERKSVVTAGSLPFEAKLARVATLTDELGYTTVWNTDWNKVSRQYTVSETRPDGRQTVSRYDIDGRLLHRTLNGKMTFVLTSDGDLIEKVTNQRGLITTTEYDSERNPVRVTHPDGTQESWAYGSTLSVKTRHTNEAGVSTLWDYDGKGNLVKQTEAAGLPEQRITTWTYDVYGQPLSQTVSQHIQTEVGMVTQTIIRRRSYDAYGNVASRRNGEGHTTTYTHNAQGKELTQTDPLGRIWQSQYDAAGKLKSHINPLGHSTAYDHDARGRLVAIVNPLGSRTQYRYDAKGQHIETINALGQSSVFAYDVAGRQVERTSPGGLVSTQNFDAIGNLVAKSDPAGDVTVYEYGEPGSGSEGLITKVVFPTYREEYRYDPRGRRVQIRQVLEANKVLAAYIGYDVTGQVVSETLPGGSTTVTRYDALGRVVEVLDALGGATRQTWDVLNNRLSLIDGNGNVQRFTYDGNGNLISEIRPLGNTIFYTYNIAGERVGLQDAIGNYRAYQYNEAGLRLSETYTAAGYVQPEQSIQYFYDPAGQLNGIEQSGGTSSHFIYDRDVLGRTIQEKITYGSGPSAVTFNIGYAYNSDAQLSKVVYPGGSEVAYNYQRGRLIEAILPNEKEFFWSDYDWKQPTQIKLPSAMQTYGYDPLQRLSKIEVKGNQGGGVEWNYQYDSSGNVIERETENGLFLYAYDALDRLVQVVPPLVLQNRLPIEDYQYDAVHNRIASLHQPGNWQYNGNNQLLQWGSGSSLNVRTYTESGNTETETRQGVSVGYIYNAADRMARVKYNGVELADYEYDSLGRRIKKTLNGESVWYVYSNQGLIAELDEKGLLKQTYGWLPNQPWGKAPLWTAYGTDQKFAEYHYFINDHLGTPQLAIDANGAVSWKNQSEAFGKSTPDVNNRITMNLRFPGQYFDGETGMAYNYFRDYDSEVGRYLQEDFLGVRAGVNFYVYANANPLRFFDELGLKARMCCRPIGITADVAYHCFISIKEDEEPCPRCPPVVYVGQLALHGPGALGSGKSGGGHVGATGFDNPNAADAVCGEWDTGCDTDDCLVMLSLQYNQETDYGTVRSNSNSFAFYLARSCGMTGFPDVWAPGKDDGPSPPYTPNPPYPPSSTS